MILTDREIQTAIGRKQIIIDPEPLEKAYSSTSVDLTLDPILSIFKPEKSGIKTVIDPSVDNFNAEDTIKELAEVFPIVEEGYALQPQKLVLGYTNEYIDLRNDPKIAARVEGKSSLARLGLTVHMTAPTIHAGFEGRVRLEIVNHGHLPILLKSHMRICQLVFEQTLGTPTKAYIGQFKGQKPG